MTLSRADVRRLLSANGLRPSRALGQNFVVDPNTVRRIARLAELAPGAPVVEVGAGLGSLTLALAETGARVVAIEVDRHLAPVLRSVVEPEGVTVVEADAMELDWNSVVGVEGPEWSLVANLPYNVATPVLIRVLEEAPQVTKMLVMVQQEVGERLAAGPGSKTYGSPSVRVAYWATARVAGKVPRTVFLPEPRVESVLVRIERLETPAVDPSLVSYTRLFEVVRAGFGQRRKMLRRSLGGIVDEAAFEAAGIEPSARAEELDVHSWGRLAAWRAP